MTDGTFQEPEQQAKRWEPSYVRLSPDQATEKITTLCAFIEQHRTEHDPDRARQLGLGRGAYCYRLLDEMALTEFEASLSPKPEREVSPAELRAARNRRYYLRKKGLSAV